MKKQHIALIAVLVVILAGLTVLAANKYDNRPVAKPGPSVSQLKRQRDLALTDLRISKELDSTHQTAATNQITTLTSQKATLCAQIKTARLIQPLCQ